MKTPCELVRQTSLMMYPFMQETALKIWRQLDVEDAHKKLHLEKLNGWIAVPILEGRKWRGAHDKCL